MSTKEKIPWHRIAAESVAIVGSVLLAFAIDSWWSASQERKEEQEILAALKQEAQFNLGQIQYYSQARRAILDAAMQLLNAAAGNATLDSAELDRLVGSLMWYAEATWSTGAVDSLIQSGNLSLIENDSLRAMVAALPQRLAKTNQLERTEDFETYSLRLMPFLSKNALVPQLSNAQLTRPGTGDYGLPRLPAGEPRDHSYLIENAEFIGIATQRVWAQNDTISEYADLSQKLEDLIRAINENIGE